MKPELPWHQLNGLRFGIYSGDEILKLSVKEITNPETFDALMHPNYGGLYDPALGPNDRNDVCTTCGLTSLHCPGHMGHISLTLPVYNPVFFRLMIQILRGSCLNCFRVLAGDLQVCLFKKQMELLKHGLIHKVYELKDIFNGLTTEYGTKDTADNKIEEELTAAVEEALQEITEDEREQKHHVKNVVDVQQRLIRGFIEENLRCQKAKCRHCSKHVCPVRSEYNSKVFLQSDKNRKNPLNYLKNLLSTPSKKNVRPAEEEKENSVPGELQKQYMTPVEARDVLRKVCENDEDVLKSLFPCLNVPCAEGKAATDLFFLEIVPVAP